jgi:hypothetical protein
MYGVPKSGQALIVHQIQYYNNLRPRDIPSLKCQEKSKLDLLQIFNSSMLFGHIANKYSSSLGPIKNKRTRRILNFLLFKNLLVRYPVKYFLNHF